MKIIVTGSSGLLGKCLVFRLAQFGHDVVCLSRCPLIDLPNGVTNIVLDFSTEWSIDNLPSDVDVIIHLAQSAKFRDFPDEALDVFDVNINSTVRLLDYAKRTGVKKFIYASSGGVYGNGSHAFKENSPIIQAGKLGFYLGSKACGEILVQSYSSEFQVGIIRPFFMYGPGQNRSMLIPRLFDSVKNNREIIIQGESGIKINPVHVSDAADAVLQLLVSGHSSVYNIAGPDVLSIKDICDSIGSYLGIDPVYKRSDIIALDLIADISAMIKELHIPKKSLAKVLHDVEL